jgi:hypothetical protein
MTSEQPDVNVAIDAIPGRSVPMPVLAVGGGAMVIGVLAFGFGMTQNVAWTWGAVLVGLVYTLALAMGGVAFSIISTMTWARWSRPLKRVGEAFGLVLPLLWLVLLVFLVFGLKIYPWNPATIVDGGPVNLAPHSDAVLFASKQWWLTPGFFMLRQLAGIGLMTVLSLVYLRASIAPDLAMARARLGDRAPAWWASFAGSATVDSGQWTQETLGPILGWTYAITMSMVAFDMIMSLSPLWYSNMFGGWIFCSSFWLTMQALGIYTLTMRDWLGLKGWVIPKTMHDLGMLLMAFTMAWAYMCFAQILPIWYANLPEETQFLLIRMGLPAWGWMARTVAVLCFIMPFTTLTSRGIKKMRWPFVALLSVMMIGVFLERTLLVMPSIYKGTEFPVVLFAVVSVGIWIGFLGFFFTTVTFILSKIPTLVISDPKLGTHPWDTHVHAVVEGH